MNKKYHWTEKEINFIKDNYCKLGQKTCALSLNKPIHIVCQLAKKLKIKVDKSERYRKMSLIMKEIIDKRPLETLNVNPTQFYNPSSPEIAYLLGLLWADGHVGNKGRDYVICIRSLLEDANDYEKIIQKTGKWNIIIPKKRGKRRKSKEFRVGNKPLVKFLCEYDYDAKSWKSADKILSLIPENLQHYWFRGLIDGDGCIYKTAYQVEISSGYTQDWNYMENLCKKMKLNYRIRRRKDGKHGHSSFYISKRDSFFRFLEYIYQNYENDKIGFTRKYKLFNKKKRNLQN